MSSFTWLDYSDRERQQVMEVIDLFREEDTRDELGIGTIRDALSDLLFPGTSTIQTRLRYFLFVPWIMRRMEDRHVPSEKAPAQSRRLHGWLCEALKQGGETSGVIGARVGKNVQRLPSSVYWQGLQSWGIRLHHGSEAAYFQSLDAFHRHRRSSRQRHEHDADENHSLTNWDPALPEPPEDLFDAATFRLTEEEADYLADRVRRRAPNSLLRALIDKGTTSEGDIRFVWDHSAVNDLEPQLKDLLTHARNFSEMMHGAALLYNLLLAETSRRDDLVENYRERLTLWWSMMSSRWERFESWTAGAFWEVLDGGNARVPLPTRQFVNAWREQMHAAGSLSDLIEDRTTRDLIINRERRLKRKRARITNPSMLENWGGASGSAQLDYRWNQPVRSYLHDLAEAFSFGDDDA